MLQGDDVSLPGVRFNIKFNIPSEVWVSHEESPNISHFPSMTFPLYVFHTDTGDNWLLLFDKCIQRYIPYYNITTNCPKSYFFFHKLFQHK